MRGKSSQISADKHPYSLYVNMVFMSNGSLSCIALTVQTVSTNSQWTFSDRHIPKSRNHNTVKHVEYCGFTDYSYWWPAWLQFWSHSREGSVQPALHIHLHDESADQVSQYQRLPAGRVCQPHQMSGSSDNGATHHLQDLWSEQLNCIKQVSGGVPAEYVQYDRIH